jgi:predicted ferric reductase
MAFTPTAAPRRRGTDLPRRRPAPAAAVVAAAAAAGLGGVLYMGVAAESAGALAAPGGVATFLGQLAGLSGTYLLLLMVVLVARIPVLERHVGLDRLLRWHRLLGQWPVYLIAAHVLLVTTGYARTGRTGVIRQFEVLLESYPDVLAALVAFALIVTTVLVSIRRIRRSMRYETWWSIHLYLYLALALAYAHQIADGQSFVTHPLDRWVWAALWASTAGTVAVYRLGVPVIRSLRHGLRVVSVSEEAPGVVSVVCRGRQLENLGVEGGQFFQWRFLAAGHWWSAHPYSLSALPRRNLLRFTVKDQGDHSSRLASMPAGTRVLIEGPYGTFTRHASSRRRVLLVGAGVGVTPVRALLEHLPSGTDVVLLLRVSKEEDLLFRAEFEALVSRRRGKMLVLAGSRQRWPLHPDQLAQLVPDLAAREVYVCSPEPLARRVVASARALGVPDDAVHFEQFKF